MLHRLLLLDSLGQRVDADRLPLASGHGEDYSESSIRIDCSKFQDDLCCPEILVCPLVPGKVFLIKKIPYTAGIVFSIISIPNLALSEIDGQCPPSWEWYGLARLLYMSQL